MNKILTSVKIHQILHNSLQLVVVQIYFSKTKQTCVRQKNKKIITNSPIILQCDANLLLKQSKLVQKKKYENE